MKPKENRDLLPKALLKLQVLTITWTKLTLELFLTQACAFFSQAVGKGMILTQTDISAAYLESFLEEDIYMEAPPDLWNHGKPPVDGDARKPIYSTTGF